ncbi:MAG: MFS transporter [Candidatus Thorarchaeota archaeon]
MDSEISSEDLLDIPDEKAGMHQVWMLALSLSILQVGFGIVMPIFPYYIVELGVGAIELGILAASFAITRIFLSGPFGGLSDRIGRKPVLLGALLGFAIANVIYAFAPNIEVMIAARALEGAVSAGFYPAANAYVSDVTSSANRGAAMGYLSMGNMVGFVIGPTIGGILAEFLGIRLPFIIAAIATMGTFVVLSIIVKEPEHRVDYSSRKPKISVREVFSKSKRSYSVLGFAMFANMFAFGILEVAFMLDAVLRFAFTPLQIGIFFGILGIIVIIGNIVFGKISDRYGRKWIIVIGSAVGAASLIMFVIASDVLGFYFAGAILGIGVSMRGPTIQALIADLTDREAYGSVMGAFGAVSNSAYVVGPLLGGYLFDTSGDSTSSLLVASLMSVIGVFVAAIGLPSSIDRSRSAEGKSVDDVVVDDLDPDLT